MNRTDILGSILGGALGGINYEVGRDAELQRNTGMQAQIAQRQAIAQQQAMNYQMSQCRNIAALGRIMAYNRQRNAEIIELATQGVEPVKQVPSEPRRVTVQDIFDYHLLKDNCHYCSSRLPQVCPIHS